MGESATVSTVARKLFSKDSMASASMAIFKTTLSND